MKDSDILKKIGQGDESVLDYLYEKYYGMMLRMIVKNNGTEEEGKDIFQEALIAFWQKAAGGKLVMTSKISTYLYGICHNLWLKELERKSRWSHEEKETAEAPSYEEHENYKIIMNCINELGDTCKNILMYHYFDGLPMSDIARKMNFANADTAKTKKYKCKKRLDQLVRNRYKKTDFFDQ